MVLGDLLWVTISTLLQAPSSGATAPRSAAQGAQTGGRPASVRPATPLRSSAIPLSATGLRSASGGVVGGGGLGGLLARAASLQPLQQGGAATTAAPSTFQAAGGGRGSSLATALTGSAAPATDGATNRGRDAGAETVVLPALVLSSLSGGPLSDAEAEALVAALTSRASTDTGAGRSARHDRLLDVAPDPELAQVADLLDGRASGGASVPAQALDGERLRAWFQELDKSRDAAITFLEWRDRTAAPLDLFRSIDQSHEGLISFEEFARAMVLNAARRQQPEIEPRLLEWTVATTKGSDPAAVTSADALDELSFDEILARARVEVAAGAALAQAKAALKQRQQDAASSEPGPNAGNATSGASKATPPTGGPVATPPVRPKPVPRKKPARKGN